MSLFVGVFFSFVLFFKFNWYFLLKSVVSVCIGFSTVICVALACGTEVFETFLCVEFGVSSIFCILMLVCSLVSVMVITIIIS